MAEALGHSVEVLVSQNLKANSPLDRKIIAVDIAERDALLTVSRYHGMSVFVQSDGNTYQLQNAGDLSVWTEVVAKPAGNDTEIQFNNAGAFGASPNFKLGDDGSGNISLALGESSTTWGIDALIFPGFLGASHFYTDGSGNSVIAIGVNTAGYGGLSINNNSSQEVISLTAAPAAESFINVGKPLGVGTATPNAETTLDIVGTNSIKITSGTTAERPSTPVASMFRYNSTLNVPEIYNGTSWLDLTTGAGGIGEAPIDGTPYNRQDAGWVVAVSGGGASPLTTKGDLFTYSTLDARLPIGANGLVLTADSAEATGMKWVAVSGGWGLSGDSTLTGNVNILGNGNQLKLGTATDNVLIFEIYATSNIRLDTGGTFGFNRNHSFGGSTYVGVGSFSSVSSGTPGVNSGANIGIGMDMSNGSPWTGATFGAKWDNATSGVRQSRLVFSGAIGTEVGAQDFLTLGYQNIIFGDADIAAQVKNISVGGTGNAALTLAGAGTGGVGIGVAPTASTFAIAGLPTSSAGLGTGDVWNNAGILTII